MKMTITPADMKALESRFMEENHVPGALLMEHAALGVVEAIARYTDKGTVVFLCGPGNNGGDGYAAARLWAARGGMSHIIEVTEDVHGDALLNRNLAAMNPNILFSSAEDAYYGNPECDVVVDALFGTGLARPIAGAAADLVHFALDAQMHGKPVIAVAEYGNGARTEFKASDNLYYDYFSSESKICVLADNSTASASECLIGCMVDYGALKMENIYLCERVTQRVVSGETVVETEAKTYGKGIMQTTFTRNPLSPNTEAIKLTTASVLWPVSHRCIHGKGVTEEDGAKKIEEKYFADGEIQSALDDFLG